MPTFILGPSSARRAAIAIVLGAILLIATAWTVVLERAAFEREDALRGVQRQNANLALAFEQHIRGALKSVDHLLADASDNVSQDDPKNRLRWGLSRTLDMSMVSFVGFVDAAGTLLYGSADFEPISVADKDYYLRHRDRAIRGVLIGKPYVGSVSGVLEIPVSRRLEGIEGQFLGVLVAGVEVRYFTEIFERINLGRQGAVTLVGLDGVLRARRSSGGILSGKNMSRSRLVEAARHDVEGYVLARGQLDGIPRLTSFRKLSDYDLVVAVGTSMEDALAGVTARARSYYIAAAASSILVTGLAALLLWLLERQRRASEEQRRADERYRLTFDRAPIGIAHNDADGRLVKVNTRFCEMLGYTEEELLQRRVVDLMHPEDAAALLASLPPPAAPMSLERRLVRKSGSVMHASVAVSTVKVEGVPYYVAMVEDITARKAAESALRSSEQRLRRYFEIGLVGMVISDVEKGMVEVNERICQILGYSRDELLKLDWVSLTHPADLMRESTAFQSVLDGTKDGYSIEKRFIRKDGRIVLATMAVKCVRKVDGSVDYFVGLLDDITERHHAEQRLRATFHQAAAGIAICTLELQMLEVNPYFAGMLGYKPEEVIGRFAVEFAHPEDKSRSLRLRDEALASREVAMSQEFEQRFVHKNGSIVWAAMARALVRDANGDPSCFVTMSRDITDRKAALDRVEKAEARYRATFEQTAVGVAHSTPDGRITAVNRKYCDMLGYSEQELLQLEFFAITHPDDLSNNRAVLERLLNDPATSQISNYEKRYIRKDGSVLWVSMAVSVVRDADGKPEYVISMAQDITDRKGAEAQLLHQAHYDTLTGLPNRVLFQDRLAQYLVHARRKLWTTGLLYLNLDRFKNVNGTYGHAGGDDVLRQVANRLCQAVRSGDTIARIGADEFAIVVSELQQAAEAEMVARKVIDALATPFQLNGDEVVLSASIGIATEPPNGSGGQALLTNAGTAMARAKESGRNNVQFYATGMNERTSRQVKLHADLRRALERGEFLLHYQPKASFATGEVVAFETLLRWNHSDKGLVSPADFIPLLEETGMIVPVGSWVIRAVGAQIRAWRDAGLRVVPVAINVSAKQFTDELCHLVEQALREHELEPGLIEIEITESDAMRDPARAIAVTRRLRAMGVGVSIDDFGTGYSSLGYLKRFPVQALKLDRSFVNGLPSDPDDVSIARAVISMAHSLGLRVVAEGVETEQQRAFLADNGCDEMQGYLLARPLPVDQCPRYLARALPEISETA